MIGSNTLTMNQATMVAAVQCYLATQFQDGKVPTVKSVKVAASESRRGYGDTTADFAVELESPEAKPD